MWLWLAEHNGRVKVIDKTNCSQALGQIQNIMLSSLHLQTFNQTIVLTIGQSVFNFSFELITLKLKKLKKWSNFSICDSHVRHLNHKIDFYFFFQEKTYIIIIGL